MPFCRNIWYTIPSYNTLMKRKILYTYLSLLFAFAMSGCDANGRFKLHSSLTGTLAVASASTKEKKNHYTIQVDVATQGVYNLIKGKRTERYLSKGHIRKGVYYSDYFSIERWQARNKFHDRAEYRFDYKKRKILKRFRTWNGNKVTADRKETLKQFGHDDYLTVVRNAIQSHRKTSGQRHTYIVAGSEETHGKVPIYLSDDPKRIKRWGGVAGGTLLQMGIHKGIFKKGSGSMTVLLDSRQQPLKIIFSNMETIGTLTGVPVR